jgi:hypothetical protein
VTVLSGVVVAERTSRRTGCTPRSVAPPQLRSELVQNQQLDPDHWQRTGPEGYGQPPGPGLDIVRIAEGGQSQDALLQADQDQCGTLVGGDR